MSLFVISSLLITVVIMRILIVFFNKGIAEASKIIIIITEQVGSTYPLPPQVGASFYTRADAIAMIEPIKSPITCRKTPCVAKSF